MDELISKQAAIDAVISLCDDCDSDYCGECRVNYPGEKDARKTLEGLPSAQQWIPVTEQLPERYGRFIVTIVPDAGELWKTIEFAMYSDLMGLVKTPVFWLGNVGKSDFEDVTSKVIAWMPLPKPYRKDTDDGEIH